MTGPTDPRPVPDLPSLAEPLPDLARFAFAAAPRLCRAEHGCADYHRAWSMIRLLLKASALPGGSDYFLPWLLRAARGGTCRILLSGAADTGLAAMVLQALQPTGIRADLVLADRCATTLEQNLRYADHLGLRFEVHLTDLAALRCAPVDAILSHSVLNFLPAAARPGLIAAWAECLRPGGYLIGRQRFGPTGRDRDPARSESQAEELAAAALAQGFSPEEAAEIKAAGRAFWAAQLTHPAMQADAFADLLRGAGLTLMDQTTPAKAAISSPMRQGMGDSAGPQSMFAALKTDTPPR